MILAAMTLLIIVGTVAAFLVTLVLVHVISVETAVGIFLLFIALLVYLAIIRPNLGK